MIITKALSGGSDANTAWRVWHTGLSGMSKRLEWNDDGVEATSATSGITLHLQLVYSL